MSQKRLFQVFDEMNVNDGENKTATLACCFDLVSAKTANGGGHVTMGIPSEAIIKIMNNEYKPMLILLDYKEYKRLEAIPLDDKLQAAEAKIEMYEKALKEIRNLAAAIGSPRGNEIYKIAIEAITPKPITDEPVK